jgi:acetyl-CoA carboxylase biotin carboxylase subunit
MMASGVPCVPGPVESLPADHAAIEAIADAVGYPLILKAAGGGGGRGMRVAHGPHELAEMVTATREEADRYFGNPDVYVEKFLEKPRHIEIQVICDGHGRALWLGDRDCSVQRRHQKIIEEGPAPGIDRSAIETVGEQCVEACRRIGYVGAGTFEFLYQDGAFHFIEMNTRVQVEHPVTETVTGLDIVAMQIVAAAGERFTLCQSDVGGAGHAIECRINAEDPFTFRPAPGPIGSLRLPGGPGVRVDTHIVAGYVVPGHYDSMIAKLIVHGRDRADALGRMRAALGEMEIGGTTTNLALHRILMDDPQFAAGGVDIHFLETWLEKRARQ